MSLQRLARELDETARQTDAMVEGIMAALAVLADRTRPGDETRRQAETMIVTALQGQDRIQQRCRNMALAVRQFALLPAGTPLATYEEIWKNLVLDELRVAALSGIAARISHGEAELF